jgi:hypothetical protein
VRTALLDGRDVLGCNCTCGRLRARAGDFFALVVCSRPTVLVGGFSDGGMQCTSGRLIPGCLEESSLAGG